MKFIKSRYSIIIILAIVTLSTIGLSFYTSTAYFNSPTYEDLIEATKKGKAKRVSKLLKRGVKVKKCGHENNNQTALLYAAYLGHLRILKKLVDAGECVSRRGIIYKNELKNDPYPVPPLYYALVQKDRNRVKIAKYLLFNCANPLSKISRKNEYSTIFQIAVGFSLHEIYKIMFYKVESEILRDKDLSASLVYTAIGNGNLEALKFFKEHGINITYNWPESPGTPLTHAVLTSNFKVIEFLVKVGANPYLKNGQGKTAIEYARQNSSDTIYKYLKSAAQKQKAKSK